MRRLSPLLAPFLTALMLASLQGAVHAQEPAGQRAVRTLDRRIATAERRVRTWNERLERWHERIARTAASVDRLTARAGASEPVEPEGAMHGFPRRGLVAHRLSRAHVRLRSVLRDRTARRAQRQLEVWAAVLAELQRARERSLRRQDHAEPVHGPVLAGPATYESWARGFLATLGAPACEENLVIVVTWETAESTDAVFNPLATTHDMRGATDFNSVGVKNYRSLAQGLDASRDTLLGGAESYGYAAIVGSLQACAPAEATAVAINLSAWCRGCVGGTYITGLLPIVRADYAAHAERAISTAA